MSTPADPTRPHVPNQLPSHLGATDAGPTDARLPALPGATSAPAIGAEQSGPAVVPTLPAIRSSDAERQQVVAILGDAAAEGRITLAEFSDRAALAWAARTGAELSPLTADLPAVSSGQALAAPRSPVTEHVPIGAIKRSGSWRLGRSTTLGTTVGPLKIDLSGAEIDGQEVDLQLSARWGSIKVWVPRGVRLQVSGATSVGTRTIEEGVGPPGGPLIRLRVDTSWGTVKVFRV